MKHLVLASIFYLFFLLLLLKKDKNDGEKELFKKQYWKSSHVIAVIMTIILYGYLINFLVGFRCLWPLLRISVLFQSQLLFFLLLLALFHFDMKQGLEILGFKRRNLKKAIGLSLLAVVVLFAPHFLHEIFIRGNHPLYFPQKLKGVDRYVYVILAIIISPVVEESLYRGVLYSPYRKKFGPTIAIIINACIFYLGHYMFGIYLNPILSLVCCLFYEKTESIYPSIFTHGLNNLFGLLIVFNVIK